jgi:hypothetical protein
MCSASQQCSLPKAIVMGQVSRRGPTPRPDVLWSIRDEMLLGLTIIVEH